MRQILYLVRRLFYTVFVLLGVITIVFFISHLVPGDPTFALVGPDAPQDIIDNMRAKFGLDKPLLIQYFLYLKNLLLHQDLGFSIQNQREVIEDIKRYFPATFELATLTMIFAVLVAVPFGILSAVKKDQWEDHLGRLTALSGISMPIFWLGLLLQMLFAYYLGWTPLRARVTLELIMKHPVTTVTGLLCLDSMLTGNWVVFFDSIKHLILPVVTLSYPAIALMARMTRSSMLEVMNLDYIRAAIAYGVPRWSVIFRHALPNAIMPTLTIIGIAYSRLLGGTVLVETIFDWPGMGLFAVSSVFTLDYPAIVGVTLMYGFFRVVLNLLVDLCYLFLDPRITLESGA